MAFIRLYKDTDFDACAQIVRRPSSPGFGDDIPAVVFIIHPPMDAFQQTKETTIVVIEKRLTDNPIQCIATLPPTLASSPAAAKLSPYLWTHPYTFLSPSTCHVLDDGTGTAVGYCIGCPDVHAFVADYERYIKAILSRDVEAPAFDTREPWMVPVDTKNKPISTGGDGPPQDSPGGDNATAMQMNPRALAQNAYRADWMLLEGILGAVAKRWRATMHIDLLPAWQGQGWGRQLIERFVASVVSSGQDYGQGEHIGVAGENSKVVPFYEKVGFRVVEGGEREGNIIMVRDIGKF
ncbi:hypothetical protein F5Y01DRAFT_317673 [Xylaria sp. FL0043]|nr:hypothetical protein F5Y01DRAFT_317673 [Xylaria sp. FL0043]